MKKFLLIITLLFFPFNLFAQEETTTAVAEENQYFNLKLTQISQSVLNKSVKYRLEITPLKDSPETQILWEVPVSFSVNTRHPEFVSLSSGQTYVYEATIFPNRAGTYEITATVTSWQFDTNYTNTASQSLTLNDSLVSQPVSSDYQVGVILLTVLILLLSGGAVWGVIKVTKLVMHKTKKWLTPPT